MHDMFGQKLRVGNYVIWKHPFYPQLTIAPISHFGEEDGRYILWVDTSNVKGNIAADEIGLSSSQVCKISSKLATFYLLKRT